MYSGNLDSSMGFLGRSAAEALPVQAFRSRSVFSRDSWSFLKRVTVVPDDRRFWNMFRPFLGTLPIAAAELPGWSTPDSTLHVGCQNRVRTMELRRGLEIRIEVEADSVTVQCVSGG